MIRIPRKEVPINDHFLSMERDIRGQLAAEALRTGQPRTKESVTKAWDSLLPETQLAIINKTWWVQVQNANRLNALMLRIQDRKQTDDPRDYLRTE